MFDVIEGLRDCDFSYMLAFFILNLAPYPVVMSSGSPSNLDRFSAS